MMNRRIFLVPLLALAGTSLSGCVAVAIPALAGSAIVGTTIDGKDAGEAKPAASAPAPAVAAAAPRPAPAPNPSVTVMPGVSAPPTSAAAKAPVIAPAPGPVAAPVVPAARPVTPAPAPVAVPASAPAPAMAAPATPAPDASSRPEQFGFSQFVRYGRGVAAVSAGAKGPLSAMLADPIALDGQRKRCAAGEQPVAVIDLDPAGSVFAPPADPERDVGRALGLAVLRESGVKIAWLSDLPVAQIGAVRTALEFAGLDERFQYLRNPEAGKALETAIGDGWFLIEPIFPAAK